MPTKFQPPSFIPKSPLSSGSAKQKKSGGTIDLSKLISYTVLFITILGAVGVFAYQRYTVSRVESQEAELEQVRQSLNDGLIRELVRFDTRLTEAEKLLNNHVILSPFFDELERRTLQSVQFTGLTLDRNDRGEMVANISGLTGSYTEIALQSDSFGNSQWLLNPIVSNFSTDLSGNITFTFTMTLDPDLISYASSLEQ